MASIFLLLLLVVGATQATAPPSCQGDPTSWCWDMATVTRCGWEKQCRDLWDSLALGDVAEGNGVADEDSVAQGRGIKCSLCTRVLKKIQVLAGDNPDKAAVEAAMQKGCRLLGRALGRQCQRLVEKYQDQITSGLEDGDSPQDICTAMGICRS